MNELFTFIVEHDGASSVSQIRSSSIGVAFEGWRLDLQSYLKEILQEHDIGELQQSLKSETPTPLHGIANVWFVCGITASHLARINIVRTLG